jgi:long-chain acyl-CoA synthetase
MSGMLISGTRSLSCEALGERVARAARVLADRGVGKGDVVAFCLRNDFPLFEGAYATAMLGAYAVPMNWHFKAAEAAHVLRDSGAKVLVVHADLLPPLAASIPAGVAVLQVATPPEIARAYAMPDDAGRAPPGAADWDALVDAAAPFGPPGRPLPISIIYTSGTTGVPKGVRRHLPTSEQLAAARRIFATTYGFDGPVRAIATGPLYHSAPYSYATRCIHFGGTLVLQPRFDAEELLQLIERHRRPTASLFRSVLLSAHAMSHSSTYIIPGAPTKGRSSAARCYTLYYVRTPHAAGYRVSRSPEATPRRHTRRCKHA